MKSDWLCIVFVGMFVYQAINNPFWAVVAWPLIGLCIAGSVACLGGKPRFGKFAIAWPFALFNDRVKRWCYL